MQGLQAPDLTVVGAGADPRMWRPEPTFPPPRITVAPVSSPSDTVVLISRARFAKVNSGPSLPLRSNLLDFISDPPPCSEGPEDRIRIPMRLASHLLTLKTLSPTRIGYSLRGKRASPPRASQVVLQEGKRRRVWPDERSVI